MPSHEERNQAAHALVDALAAAPIGIQRVAMNAAAHAKAAFNFDEECEKLYESAIGLMPRTIEELEDPIRYAAWCIRSMKHERKTRSKILMVQHIGKVFGHDKRTIEVKDQSTFRDVIRSFQERLAQEQIIDGEVVKALPADAPR